MIEPTVVRKPVASWGVEEAFEKMMDEADAADYVSYNRHVSGALAFLVGAASSASPRDALKLVKFASALINWRAARVIPSEIRAAEERPAEVVS